MRRSKLIPEVNAGSMADIAFLLLIFFLVTATIPKDTGINRKLAKENEIPHPITIQERNILRIVINNNDEIMVDDDLILIDELKDLVASFIDNNGDGTCNYCNGIKNEKASNNPKKAVVSLQTGTLTSYNQFIEVQDELTKAYYQLRQTYSQNVLKKEVENLSKTDLKKVKDAYPFILSEALTK
ncbi:biopolymer transporter ExbD [Sabulilitoribacter arenilitoris]|uniref:Biopolymer transporter ExbD n=1 Tax=Wocania arenilitoris TaxID=2044858 RepID=A0AAE3JNE6_9FLAO|nr:biopolymer transporter ExbD [Wocania arenilitoris]MCF7568596.1 biopolymer transporter ExbD [Wocania arenilitoris]